MTQLTAAATKNVRIPRPKVRTREEPRIYPKICATVVVTPLTSREDRYNEAISLIERVHRNFLDVVKLELDGLGTRDINNVQGLMLLNIGDAEMTIGELMLRGCYLGSNVSYNVKKMVENGYLAQQRSVHDRRSIHVRLTNKGSQLRDRLHAMHQRHLKMLNETAITDDDLAAATVTLRRLERFWTRAGDLVQHRDRPDAHFSAQRFPPSRI